MDSKSKVAAVRERHHWNRAQLAFILGVDPATITRWGQGDREPEGVAVPMLDLLLDPMFGTSVAAWLKERAVKGEK